MTEDAVRAVVARHTEQPLLGFLGEPRVNVLRAQPRPRRPAGDDRSGPSAHDRRPRRADRPARRCSPGSPPTSRRRARPPARLPRHGARRRQDLPDARGGPSPARARDGPRRRLRRGARPAARPRSCSTASRSCPRRRIEYRGVVVEEMDTDAVLARRPDGRPDRRAGPHQRARARRATKRWEDVEVIRDAGIDVVSTCNVQHLESRRRRGRDDHRRARSTSASRTRSSPTADEIELVDMSPHALRQRMQPRQRLPAGAGRRSPSTGSSPSRT